ncbi:putative DNA binding domain-containing protein [Isoptericola sp. NEAU-Y5]|uniref:DNA binding domain-containing protein n=1 Tax=Isoptericola luteus TaxID=2879484 RepID=A0ABS7ZI69_9MICO|nr:ATP-binding protein [Isoptericola sp. NEAU-Y5]MCA5894202.1 putative DNA binding domain-containing protein [Isoptericola sp. NEAU-Y5]
MDAQQAAHLIAQGETLEVEFKSEQRHAYADRELTEAVACLANGTGGVLFLGVEDDGTVTGARPRHGGRTDPFRVQAAIANATIPPLSTRVSLLSIASQDVTAIEVDEATTPIGTTTGRYTRRALRNDGMPECTPYPLHEMLSRTTSTGESDYATLRVHGATWADLDPAEFDRFRRLAASQPGDGTLAVLSDVEIARSLGVTEPGTAGPTPLMGALLLFGTADALARFAPTHETFFQVMHGSDVKVNEQVVGGLLKSAEELFNRFSPYNTEEEVDAGLVRIALPRVPELALREAIANALVHRDYTMTGAVRLQVGDDAVVISSPGSFPRGITLDNILDHSRPRSRTLADAFKRVGIVERTGRGIPRMFESTLRIGRDAPDYSRSTSDAVVASFATSDADAALARFVFEKESVQGGPMPLSVLQVLHELRREGDLSVAEAARLLQRTEGEARASLTKMVEAGLVEPRGSGRGRRYHLSAATYRALHSDPGYVRVRGLDRIQQRPMVLTYVRAHGSITRATAAELCAIAPPAATTLLRSMVDDGDLELRGERRGAHYVLADPPPTEA